MNVPTPGELAQMPVERIHEMLTDCADRGTFLSAELDGLRQWQQQRRALLRQCARLHSQVQAMGDELARLKEAKGDGRRIDGNRETM